MSKLQVLVVDDMNSVRQMIKRQLQNYGIESIESAINGAEALDMVKDSLERGKKYDLFLIDINMPGMNGISLLKNIRNINDYFHTPVIMVTTENEKEVVLEAALVGATDYLVKPFDEETFESKINTVLEKLESSHS